MGKPVGVLFDVDGTLVDTPYLHVIAWWQALRQYEHDVPMARIHRAIGMGSDRIIDHLLGHERDHGDDDAMRAAHASLYAVYWTRLRPTPGARELVSACDERGLRVVLATSASAPELAALMGMLAVDEYVDTVTGADDAGTSKPAPDILEVALRRSGLRPAHVVFVGDAVWDVYASAKLDIACIGLTSGGISAGELTEAGAIEVYEHPRALLESLDKSAISAVR